MDQSSAWLQCLMNIQDRRQFFIFDINQAKRFFRRIRAQSGNSSYRFAHVTNFLYGDDGLIFKYRAVVRLDTMVVKNVVASNHRQDPWNFERLGSVNVFDAR